MHPSAALTGAKFLELYAHEDAKILDVGSLDLNGSLKHSVPAGREYTGVDVCAGPNVDIVLDDPYHFPFEDQSFDLVLSTSCFEHVEFFWLLFEEMVRVVRRGRFLYVSAPTNGPVHRHPVDCWRFYPDAGQALARWVSRMTTIDLVESFVLPPGPDGWSDFVGVWQRWASPKEVSAPRLTGYFPSAQHIRP